ncbi:MAG: 3-methyl-2-oxobutanoate hydroxymethyltransferase [Solirubrobacterales bacterium]
MSGGSRKGQDQEGGSGVSRPRVTIQDLAAMKAAGEPIVMVTAYDFPTARIADQAGVDVVLVGDSAANCVLGYDSTVPVGMDEMLVLTRAVRRGLERPLLIGDLPYGSYEASNELAIENAQRMVKDAGCDAVKLEGGGQSAERARAMVAAGIPVMGHVGLTPQTAGSIGGMKAQGRDADGAVRVARDAESLQLAGCFAIVFEAVPQAVAELITVRLSVPTIGIGAGNATSGQVLVMHDLVGLNEGPMARFVKQYGDARGAMLESVRDYAREVRDRSFPGPDHVYSVDPGELDEFRRRLEEGDLDSSYSWDWEPLG